MLSSKKQIDDPQMPGLIPLIKKLTPERPVLYRSHIQIRSDLVAKAGSPPGRRVGLPVEQHPGRRHVHQPPDPRLCPAHGASREGVLLPGHHGLA